MIANKKKSGRWYTAGTTAALLGALLAQGCAVQNNTVAGAGAPGPVAAPPQVSDAPPAAPRDFRAAWVSTVANIDWPTKKGLPVEQQKAEIIAILDKVKALNMNAVVLQVRPAADAIYPSKLEPWTEYLTGSQGKPPEPFYDPLKMWVDEAHARGLELHAWFNPYRARHSDSKTPASSDHISIAHPSSVRQYGKFLWMDPGDAWAAQRTVDVFVDVAHRYDVDGMHIDDYFYPYPIEAPRDPKAVVADGGAAALNATAPAAKAPVVELDFPDDVTWRAYQAGGGKLARADWRRQNVNGLIERLYTAIHKEKSWVRFGISPFGISRPDRRPPGICCFSQYDKLYADAELWFNNGWLDYLSPQLYWPIDQKPQAFGTLLDYWNRQNNYGRHLWPGLFTSRIDSSEKSWKTSEIINQVAMTQTKTDGQVHFSMAALMQNRRGISDELLAGPYAIPALVPATPWLGNEALAAPKVALTRAAKATNVAVTMAAGQNATQFAVWARYGKQWRFSVMPGARTAFDLNDDATVGAPDLVVVTAVDRLGNESARTSTAVTAR